MWRKVFVRTGFCAARVHTRRRRSGRGCRAGPPGTAGAGSRGHSPSLPCPALRAAAGGSGVGSSPYRKRRRAVTRDVLEPVARDLRVGPSGRHARRRDPDGRVASGGRRRSEAAGLRIEQLREEPSVRLDPADEGSMLMPCLAIQLGRTKTAAADEEGRAFLVGPPVEALREWLQRADLTKGPVFRAIDRWARSRTGR